MNLNVNEIFYSLQGEGARQGEASVFIRLTQCNMKCDFCDTDFENGTDMSLEEVLRKISVYPAKWIVWTGGEPTIQLTDEVLLFFKEKGYHQAIESNGSLPLSVWLDYTVCSPKGNFDYIKSINPEVDEVRLPVKAGDKIPDINQLPGAFRYFLSPVFDPDNNKTQANIAYCVQKVLQQPKWRLSLQVHKLIGIE